MFSFLKDSWVHNYSDEDENEYSSHNPAAAPSAPTTISEHSIPFDNTQTPPPMTTNGVIPHAHERFSDERLHRLNELEEQNSKFINQISNLQSIISSKSSLYLEYKEKYEV
jgi:hypothetical protein